MGFAFIEFCGEVGHPLLPYQRWLAIHALELRPDGLPRFRTVLVLIARQNGKTTFCKLLALWWLFVLRRPLVLGTSTKLDYARESWKGAVDLAYEAEVLFEDLLPRKRGGVRDANGEQTLTTASGCRYKIAAANADAGRSLTVYDLILDELRQHTKYDAWSAATKAMNAVPDGQVWAITNAGDDTSIVLNELWDRAHGMIAVPDSRIGLFDWSAADGCALDDRQEWAQSNPALGYGFLTELTIQDALDTDPESRFRTEVLCQRVAALEPPQISAAAWDARADPESSIVGDRVISVDVSPRGDRAAIGGAGYRPDGDVHLALVDHRPGIAWAIPRLLQLLERPDVVALVVDEGGPAAELVPDLEAAGLRVRTEADPTGEIVHMTTRDAGAAAGMLRTRVAGDAPTAWHRGEQAAHDALVGAKTRPIGNGGWGFDRRTSEDDITPIVVLSHALWGLVSGVGPQVSVHVGEDQGDANERDVESGYAAGPDLTVPGGYQFHLEPAAPQDAVDEPDDDEPGAGVVWIG